MKLCFSILCAYFRKCTLHLLSGKVLFLSVQYPYAYDHNEMTLCATEAQTWFSGLDHIFWDSSIRSSFLRGRKIHVFSNFWKTPYAIWTSEWTLILPIFTGRELTGLNLYLMISAGKMGEKSLSCMCVLRTYGLMITTWFYLVWRQAVEACQKKQKGGFWFSFPFLYLAFHVHCKDQGRSLWLRQQRIVSPCVFMINIFIGTL